MVQDDDLLICVACATQYDVPASEPLSSCKICDDPRQYIPPAGQQWTSLAKMKASEFKNKWTQDSEDKRIWSIWTEPKVGIGQRALLLETDAGKVMWDLIPYLDDETIEFINSKGGLKAIVISHPHYYSNHVQWAKTFGCPIYLAADDKEWICRPDDTGLVEFFSDATKEIVPGVNAIKVGGHFPGSLVLHWNNKLFIADSLVTVPSALYHIDRPPGTISYTFFWSIPNMIPLPPPVIHQMWEALKHWDFDTTHGAFNGLDVRGKDLKKRVLESMKIQIRAEGYADYPLLNETVA